MNSCRLKHVPSGIVKSAQTRSRPNSLKLAKAELMAELSKRLGIQVHEETNDERRQQVGSGMRGDKRRTYRFQEDRVVDHVTGKNHLCSLVLRGEMDRLWG